MKSRTSPGTFTTMDDVPIPDSPFASSGSSVEAAPNFEARPGPESLEITIDAVDVNAAARFWSEALGYERLYERPPYVVLGPVGAGPRVLIQEVDTPATGKSSVHLDLRVRDPDGEVRRLEMLGATVDRTVAEAGTTWTVMVGPGGIPFCVCPARGAAS